VRQLRDAGALVIGKTVTTEFAYLEPAATRNPHALEHTPGGSSSGSAAAVAAGLAALAIGTQTVGSVIRPAAFCGVVGFKPSHDRVSTAGLVYFARSVDHVGLFTQDVAGMARAASVVLAQFRGLPTATTLPTLGVPDGPLLDAVEPAARVAFEAQLASLEQSGVRVQRVPCLSDLEALRARHTQLIARELAAEHAQWFAQYGALYRPLTAALIRTGRQVSDAEYRAALASGAELRHALHAAMNEHGLDAWVCPSAPGPAPRGQQSTGDPVMNVAWTHAGLPVLSLPVRRGPVTEPPLRSMITIVAGAFWHAEQSCIAG
jgi:Asp-tRNA(Asn)/Glu-tRNA(Gln) amidotransferase A subunit family amidase